MDLGLSNIVSSSINQISSLLTKLIDHKWVNEDKVEKYILSLSDYIEIISKLLAELYSDYINILIDKDKTNNILKIFNIIESSLGIFIRKYYYLSIHIKTKRNNDLKKIHSEEYIGDIGITNLAKMYYDSINYGMTFYDYEKLTNMIFIHLNYQYRSPQDIFSHLYIKQNSENKFENKFENIFIQYKKL